MSEDHTNLQEPRQFADEDEMAQQHIHEIWGHHDRDADAAVNYVENMLVTVLATATRGDMKWVARSIKRLADFVAANLDEPVVLH